MMKNNDQEIGNFQFLTSIIKEEREKTTPYVTTYDNLTIDNIKKAVRNGEIKTENFILLYLYNPEEEDISIRFLNEFGARLNNRLGTDIPMFSVYPKSTFDQWSSNLTVAARRGLADQFELSDDSTPKYELMLKLAKEYGVCKDLPALVVINSRGERGYSEVFASTSFRLFDSAKRIYDKVCNVLDAIDANPYDFEAVRVACEGRKGYGTRSLSEYYELDYSRSFFNIMHNFIWEKDHSIERCASSIGMSRNGFTDFLYERVRIKLDNLFALAFHLKLKPDELNWLVLNYSSANPQTINEWKSGKNKRFNAILRFLVMGVSEYEINEKLEEEGVEIIAPFESISE